MDHALGKCGIPLRPRPASNVPAGLAAAAAPAGVSSDYSGGWPYQLAGNTRFNTCSQAAASNGMAATHFLAGGVRFNPDAFWPDQLDLYRHSGASPAFDPGPPPRGDNGSDPEAMFRYMSSHGFIADIKLPAWGAMPTAYNRFLPQDLDAFAEAVDGLGGASLVVELSAANLRQTARFTFDPGPAAAAHQVWCCGVDYGRQVVLAVSWGRLFELAFDFFLGRGLLRHVLAWPWVATRFVGRVVNEVHLADQWGRWTGGRAWFRPVPPMVEVEPAGRYAVPAADGSTLRYAPGPGWSVARGPVPGGAPWVLDAAGRVAYFP